MLFNLFTPSYPVVDVNIPEGWWKQDAQLDLDFANRRAYNKSTQFRGRPDSILTYSSPSPKMVYGADGVLGYAPHNLFLYSEAMSNASYWIDGPALNGTRSNGSVSVSADNGYAYLRQNVTAAASRNCVVSYEVTCDTTVENVPIVFSNGTTNYPVVTSLVAGVAKRVTSPVFTVPSQVSVGVDLRDAVAPGGSNTTGYIVTFNKAQLHLYPNQIIVDYIHTTSAAVYHLPIDHDPLTYAPLGVLIEEQRTNLLTYSEQFDNAAWTKSRATVTANQAVAPDGTLTADKLIPTAVDGTHRVYQAGVVHGVDGARTITCYLKAGEFLFGNVVISDSSESDRVTAQFNLTDGTISTAVTVVGAGGTFTSPTAEITSVGDGWYRCRVTATIAASEATISGWVWSGNTVSGATSFTGDGTSGIYVWGAQLEAGAFATSYIPTVASQVTRARDQVSILTSAFGYSATEGTLYTEGRITTTGTSYFAGFSDNSGSDLEYMGTRKSGAGYGANVVDGGVSQASLTTNSPAYVAGLEVEMAFAYKADDFANSIDGADVGTDVSGTLPTVTGLYVGAIRDAANHANGPIKRITYWNTRKTDAELQGLTI